MKNITDYDLIYLLGAKNWTENEQGQMMSKFASALGKFLRNQFSSNLSEQDLKELSELVQNPYITENDLVLFYQAKIPSFEKILEDALIQFKTSFVIMVYETKIRELETEMKKEDTYEKQEELGVWKEILASSKNNDWDVVSGKLNFK